MESLIAEVKQRYRGPHNVLMKSRMAALFKALPASQWREFVALAEARQVWAPWQTIIECRIFTNNEG